MRVQSLPNSEGGKHINPFAFDYILLTGTVALLFGGYCLLGFFAKRGLSPKIVKGYVFAVALIGILVFFSQLFFVPFAMTTENGTTGQLNPSVGNVFLIGVPYGENKVGNFFAWLGSLWFLASVCLSLLFCALPFRKGAFLNRFVLLPNLLLSFVTFWNVEYAFTGTMEVSYKSALLCLSLAFALSASLISLLKDWNERHFSWKEITSSLLYFLFALFAFLPVNTFATLFPTDAILFGAAQTSWRAEDFSFLHRFLIYVGIIYHFGFYFAVRSEDINGRKALLIALCLGAISAYFTRFGFEGIFQVHNGYKINVSSLPIHLCHTALFIVPLCVAFNLKRAFYFSYFINVFGAMMAMIWPNVGETYNVYSPDVLLFWYNHYAALFTPLLAVMLRIFPRPKMKQMGFSLLFFTIYFALILFANAFLSNFVEGYDPEKLGTGTDYLFINDTYILDILSDQAKHMMDVRWSWNWGELTLVIYPLYQSLFFLAYTGIAFGMWFIYALFYQIEDQHYDMHNRNLIARQQHLSFKQRKQMEALNMDEIDHSTATLEFSHFSKRYLSSDKLSANDVNLSVKGGEIFGFLGPNGAGKSTCIKTAIGIQPVTEGNITVCGYDVSEEPVKAKRCIGYVPDHYALYEKLTGREYINYIADLYGVSKEDRDARISYYVDLFELNASFDARMQTYSHGMKQKIAIMAALVHEPKVWILDEPLTGLDPQSIYQVKKTMLAHAEKGNVVFFSSHIIDVVERLCTRIAVIRKGHIVYTGTMEETLKAHPEGLEEFYMSLIEEGADER